MRLLLTALLCAASAALFVSSSRAIEAGADLSWLPAYEEGGATYLQNGKVVDPVALLCEEGFSLARLRLWHSPEKPWHGLPATLDFAERLAGGGLDIVLDIHYSDTWADPGHQAKPRAWEGVSFDALVDSVYVYTRSVVGAFVERGVRPRYVQIGNEISGGLLWDDGRVSGGWDTDEQWDRLCALLTAASAGVRDAGGESTARSALDAPPGAGRDDPQDASSRTRGPRVVIHYDDGADYLGCGRFLEGIMSRGVDFDVLGVSFYPWWHGSLVDLHANLSDLALRYGKEMMVVETGYPWTLGWCDDTHNIVGLPEHLLDGYPATPEGQAAFLADLMAAMSRVPGAAVSGVLYWEPAAVCTPDGPGSPIENLALFDFNGEALSGLGAFGSASH